MKMSDAMLVQLDSAFLRGHQQQAWQKEQRNLLI
jgi:hypothetical protein